MSDTSSTASFRGSAVSSLSQLHKSIRDGEFESMKEWLEKEPLLLLKPNSVGWTAIHLCCSHTNVPYETWVWVLNLIPPSASILDLRTDVGSNALTHFFRSYLSPQEWQRHEVKQAAKALRLLIMYLLECDEMMTYFRSILDNSPEASTATYTLSRDFTPVLLFWRRMQALLQTVEASDPLLHSLARTSCPSEVALLVMKLYPLQISLRNMQGDLPLHLACRYQDSQDILKVLLPSHADLRDEQEGRLPLHIALAHGKCIHTGVSDIWKAWPDFGGVLDHKTELSAFLLAALPDEDVVQHKAQKLAATCSLLRFMPKRSQERAVATARSKVELQHLDTVYELLRAAPNAIRCCSK